MYQYTTTALVVIKKYFVYKLLPISITSLKVNFTRGDQTNEYTDNKFKVKHYLPLTSNI